jgi:hypothetical protein
MLFRNRNKTGFVLGVDAQVQAKLLQFGDYF